MINFNVLTNFACDELLTYKHNSEVRETYNHLVYDSSNLSYIGNFVTMHLTMEDLDFGTNASDDLTNSIKLFTSLQHLDLVQANDRRLWVTLTHTLFFQYTKARWNINDSSSDDVLKDRFHFEGIGLRARNQNAVARLWWGAKITHDDKKEDPFELTRLLWEKQDLYQNLIDRKFSTYPGVLKGFLSFYSENKHIDLKYEMRKLIKGINAYGGIRILALMNEEEIKKEIYQMCVFYGIKTI